MTKISKQMVYLSIYQIWFARVKEYYLGLLTKPNMECEVILIMYTIYLADSDILKCEL